jgi:hypothetical protein
MKQSTISILKSVVFVSALGGATLATRPAMALPRTHDGFYMQLDAGLGYLSTSASVRGSDEKLSGLSFPTAILLGGTVGPVVIGGGFVTDYVASPSAKLNGQSGALTGVNLYMFSVGVFADIYPNPSGGFHIQPYIGYAGLTLEYNGYTGSGPSGMVLAAGVGYDWWVGDEWSIGIMGRMAYAPLSINGVGWSTVAPALLATFTYH